MPLATRTIDTQKFYKNSQLTKKIPDVWMLDGDTPTNQKEYMVLMAVHAISFLKESDLEHARRSSGQEKSQERKPMFSFTCAGRLDTISYKQ